MIKRQIASCLVPGCKCISVNDNEMMWSNILKHLGNVIDCELSDVADCNSKKCHFIASVNWFVSHFSGQVPLDCYLRLFQTYCSSHYGSVLWELNGKGFFQFLYIVEQMWTTRHRHSL